MYRQWIFRRTGNFPILSPRDREVVYLVMVALSKDKLGLGLTDHAASLHLVKRWTKMIFPASAGIVEASMRLLASPEQAGQLESSEILVTHKLDIGRTRLFSKCGRVVTDISMPLP